MVKIHIDTDIGGDIDDLCALAMVLAWPDAELVGVTTNSDDGGKRAGYARYALDLAGRRDVPVAAGADVSGGYYRVPLGLPREDDYWPEPIAAVPGPLEEALALIEASIGAGATIVAIGPYTNLALLERRSPGILRTAKVVLMGGCVFPIGPGLPDWGADFDWNVQVDTASALSVLRSSEPTLVPIAVTAQTALRRADLSVLRDAGPLARLIARQAEAFAGDERMEETYGRTCSDVPADIINFHHDPLACAIALGWSDGVEVAEVGVRSEVIGGWMRQRAEPAGTRTRIVTAVDGERFNGEWLRLVSGI